MKRDKMSSKDCKIGKGRSHGSCRKKRKPNSKYIRSKTLN